MTATANAADRRRAREEPNDDAGAEPERGSSFESHDATTRRLAARRRRSRSAVERVATHPACARRRPCGCRPCGRCGIRVDSNGPSPPAVRMPRALIRSRNGLRLDARGQRDRGHRRRASRELAGIAAKVRARATPSRTRSRHRRVPRVHCSRPSSWIMPQRLGDLQHELHGRRAGRLGLRLCRSRASNRREVPVVPRQRRRSHAAHARSLIADPREARARHQAFLRRRDRDVDAPFVERERHAADRRDAVDEHERAVRARDARDRRRRRSRHRSTCRRTRPRRRESRGCASSSASSSLESTSRSQLVATSDARRARTTRRAAPTSRRTCRCSTRRSRRRARRDCRSPPRARRGRSCARAAAVSAVPNTGREQLDRRPRARARTPACDGGSSAARRRASTRSGTRVGPGVISSNGSASAPPNRRHSMTPFFRSDSSISALVQHAAARSRRCARVSRAISSPTSVEHFLARRRAARPRRRPRRRRRCRPASRRCRRTRSAR